MRSFTPWKRTPKVRAGDVLILSFATSDAMTQPLL